MCFECGIVVLLPHQVGGIVVRPERGVDAFHEQHVEQLRGGLVVFSEQTQQVTHVARHARTQVIIQQVLQQALHKHANNA